MRSAGPTAAREWSCWRTSAARSLRLRAEIALRRADDAKATIAIGTYASEAPNDPRSALYSGWLFVSKGKLADAKSILAVLALGATGGTVLWLNADGEDAPAALDALSACVAGLTE